MNKIEYVHYNNTTDQTHWRRELTYTQTISHSLKTVGSIPCGWLGRVGTPALLSTSRINFGECGVKVMRELAVDA